MISSNREIAAEQQQLQQQGGRACVCEAVTTVVGEVAIELPGVHK